MRTILILAALLAGVLDAKATELPSDEEMIRQGREAIGAVMPQLGTAQPQPPAMVALPPQPPRMTPLARELMKETLDTRLPNPQAVAKRTGTSDLIVFVSFSMPDEMLQEYSKQAKQAGATLVLRGLVENSLTKTQRKAATVNPVFADWEINPAAFRKYKVSVVPAIVLANSDTAHAAQDGCAPPGAYIRVDGAISIAQALSTMAWRGEGQLAVLAKQKLRNIEEH